MLNFLQALAREFVVMFKIKKGVLMTKLHRLSFLTTICFIAAIIFTSHVYALFDSDVDKAKEFMQAGMYPQAIALLEKEINDNPTNAEAHFQIGICYINQNNYSGADERFASAVRLKSDYGYKIGKEYKRTADFAVSKVQLSEARTLYDKAIEYDPSLKRGIAQNIFDKGKKSGSDKLISLAMSYDANLKENAADYYYSQSKNSQGEAGLSLLAMASQYSNKYNNHFDKKKLETGNLFLTKAIELAKLPGKEKDTEQNKKKAIKYLGESAVKDALPDKKVYKPGQYTFALRGGEQTVHWITFPQGRITHYSLSSNDYGYKLAFDNGTIIKDGATTKYPRNQYTFKIIAITDQPKITMIVK